MTVDDPVNVSIIQLAIPDKVFILDMIGLDATQRHKEIAKFFSDIFTNDDVVKLGYDIYADLANLQESYPYLKQAEDNRLSFVDLKAIQASVEQTYPSLLNIDRNDKRRPYRGLTEFLNSCLGKPLNKDEQMSGWELRPLRWAQIQYAGTF